jgi:hypothetical protein
MNSDIMHMYVKIIRTVSFDNLPEVFKHDSKKSKLEAIVHLYEAHKKNLQQLETRLELLDQVLEDMVNSKISNVKLLEKVDLYKDDLYSHYHVNRCYNFLFYYN